MKKTFFINLLLILTYYFLVLLIAACNEEKGKSIAQKVTGIKKQACSHLYCCGKYPDFTDRKS